MPPTEGLSVNCCDSGHGRSAVDMSIELKYAPSDPKTSRKVENIYCSTALIQPRYAMKYFDVHHLLMYRFTAHMFPAELSNLESNCCIRSTTNEIPFCTSPYPGEEYLSPPNSNLSATLHRNSDNLLFIANRWNHDATVETGREKDYCTCSQKSRSRRKTHHGRTRYGRNTKTGTGTSIYFV